MSYTRVVDELRHKERLAAMEKGLELPPELAEPAETNGKSNGLRSGLIGLGVGLALGFILAMTALVTLRIATALRHRHPAS